MPEFGPPDRPLQPTCLGCLGTALFVFGFWMVGGAIFGQYDHAGWFLASVVALVAGVRLMMTKLR